MTDKVPITLLVHPAQYLALAKIAAAKTTDPAKPVQVHHLLEHLVGQALLGPKPKTVRARKTVDRDELKRLHSLGLNDRQIAERMGVSSGAIYVHRRDLDLDKNTPNGRPKQVAK